MFHYHIEIDFDDRMESMPESINSLLGKYNGVSIGHDKKGTTSLFFNTEDNLRKETLGETLGYKLVGFEKTKLREPAHVP